MIKWHSIPDHSKASKFALTVAILNFMELLHLLMTNKVIYTKIVDRHITKDKPRAARFAVSHVRCKSPEQGILVVLIFAVLYD